LNLRPSGYEPDELPDCSTPRLKLKFYHFLTISVELFLKIALHKAVFLLKKDCRVSMHKE